MGYRVYLVDSNDDWVELETEDVDLTTIFSVSDISDISKRKDRITKQISFKGTKRNNSAFGSLFHLNKSSDFEISNRLFFNYNPIRTVDCLVYEDSVLLLRGSLRVLEIAVDRFNNVTYQTVITGSFIDFRDIVSEKLLTDLDFTDLKHRYTWNNIQDTWEVRTERFNVSGNTYEFKPFEKGSGYVYPFIDNGVIYQKTSVNEVNNIHLLNFRPSIYVKEYLDRIFSQPELSGYSYEIKGDTDFVDRFHSLIIPSNVEKLSSKSTTMNVKAFTNGEQIQDVHKTNYEDGYMVRAIQMQSMNNPNNLLSWYGTYKTVNSCVLVVNRTFVSDGYCKLNLKHLFNSSSSTAKVYIQLCERESVLNDDPDFNNPNTFNIIASTFILVEPNRGVTNQVMEFEVGERTYTANTQLMLRLYVEGISNLEMGQEQVLEDYKLTYVLEGGEMRLPKSDGSIITVDIKEGDELNIQAIEGVKQMDFIKSIINLFNLYVYSEKRKPKHLIFERYDDYYVLAQPHLLPENSLNWTNKVDYSSGFKIKSNVSLPKKYLFTYKEDSDFINSNYKKNFADVYGSFRFNDSYGLDEEKKVELIFSPSPLVQYVGTNRVHPAIYQVDSNQKNPVKSNIRIMYYNGVKNCVPYKVGNDILVDAVYDAVTIASNVDRYAQCGNYFLQPGMLSTTPTDNMDFGQPRELYFDSTEEHLKAPTAYQNYRQQVTDITNPNISFIECELVLNEVDVSNIDLKTPVFIDLGEMGNAYFKVLNIEYSNNTSRSTVSLMKIAV